MKRVGIIGAGLIGAKRAAHLKDARLVAVADRDEKRAQALASAYEAEVETDWRALVERADLDIVVVATPNHLIASCAVAALESKKHVLVEKPAGRNAADVRLEIDAAKRSGRVLRVGYNHRFHPAFQRAKQMLDEGQMGPLMYIRARYGHGGRVGYDREWRADPAISGGGELLDQGVHLVDLCRWLGGDFELEWGKVRTFFWDMPVEDNGFIALKSPDGKRSAWLHASCTEWKNLFDFEIFTRTAKLEVWGLGRSYGTEELRHYRMKPEMGPPEIVVTPFPGEDQSWSLEFAAMLQEIEGVRTALATPEDALRNLEIVEAAYRLSAPCNV